MKKAEMVWRQQTKMISETTKDWTIEAWKKGSVGLIINENEDFEEDEKEIAPLIVYGLNLFIF